MANKDFSTVIREQPTQQEIRKAHNEAQAILRGGKSLPADWITLFQYAYKIGLLDGRNSANQQPITKTQATGVNNMNNQNVPTKTDWERMQARLSELNDMVEKQLDGSYRLEKMDQAQLVATIRDNNQPMEFRNRATETLLNKLGGDKVKFVELLKGK